MATKKKPQKTPRIAFDQVQELMRGSGQRADALRADGLNGLAAVKRTKLVQVRRERARLALRFGEASPQVARIDRQMAAEHRMLVNTRAEAARVETPMLDRIDSAWQLHGYVRSPDGIARKDHTVAIVADAEAREMLAETKTDARGYFRFVIDRKTKDSAGRKDAASAAAPMADKTATAAGANRNEAYVARLASSLKVKVYLATTAPSGGKPVVDPRPLNPLPGAIVYRDLRVADAKDDGGSCRLKTRFLADSSARLVHDLANETKACRIAGIPPDSRFYLMSAGQADALNYRLCPDCIGAKTSKR